MESVDHLHTICLLKIREYCIIETKHICLRIILELKAIYILGAYGDGKEKVHSFKSLLRFCILGHSKNFGLTNF